MFLIYNIYETNMGNEIMFQRQQGDRCRKGRESEGGYVGCSPVSAESLLSSSNLHESEEENLLLKGGGVLLCSTYFIM